MAEKDRKKATKKLVNELECALDHTFHPESLYWTGSEKLLNWPDELRKLIKGNESREELNRLLAKVTSVNQLDLDDAIGRARCEEAYCHFITGCLVGQFRAGVPMAEIKRQAKAMLERS